MVHLTRSKLTNMDAFTDLIDSKLRELRESLLSEFKNALDLFVEDKKTELTAFINKEKGKKLMGETPGLAESVEQIQKHVLSLKADNIMLKSRIENLEQYTRRQNVLKTLKT